MKIEIELPEDEGGIDVFWEDNAKCRLTVDKSETVLRCNKEALLSLGKQFLYLYYYYDCLGLGAHIHYDDLFCKDGWDGPDFVLSVI